MISFKDLKMFDSLVIGIENHSYSFEVWGKSKWLFYEAKKTIQSRTEMNGLFLDTIDYQKYGNKIPYTRNDCQGHSQGHASVLSSVTDRAMEYVL